MHAWSSVGASSSFTGRQERSGYKVVPMKSGTETGLPLVPCPKCGEEVVELIAGPGSKVPGAVFFKCCRHDRDDPSSCPWYLFADKYERMLIRKGIIAAKQAVPKFHTRGEGLGAATGGPDLAVPILSPIGDLDAKLKKLVTLGQIGVVCSIVIAVFVVIGVMILLLNRD